MLKTKIFASGVNNLSDARYFAAWGVEHIGFKLGASLTAASIKEMIDWVVGPTYIGEIDGIDSSPLIIEDIATIGFEHISTNPFFKGYLPPSIIQIQSYVFNEELSAISDGILKVQLPYIDLEKEQISTLRKLCVENKLWLDIQFDHNEINELLEKIEPYGLLIKGGDEEAPGIRSFDDLDLIFEEIEILV